jgi:hypothetical protein
LKLTLPVLVGAAVPATAELCAAIGAESISRGIAPWVLPDALQPKLRQEVITRRIPADAPKSDVNLRRAACSS